MNTLRGIAAFALAIAAALQAAAPASAQDAYPSRPLRAITVSGAGGAGDVMQRLIVEHLAKALGQPVVIDYRPGANGIIAATAAAKADPDGYTLFISNVGAVAVNKALYTKLPYDPERDFAPVSMVVTSPLFLITNSEVPVANVRDVIALAKKDPKSLTLGYPGSTGMLTGSNFLQLAGIDLLQVPYKTVPATMLDLIANRIQLYFAASTNTVPQVMAGKVKALAVTTTTRSPVLPDVPTMQEAGVPGFSSDFWFGFFVPAGTPPEIVARLNREIVRVLQLPEVRDRLAAQGDIVIGSTPEAFRDKIRDDVAKYRDIIRKGNIPQIDN
jgi:tripartite-type tricarboxylate transporter receptor subunit TctC